MSTSNDKTTNGPSVSVTNNSGVDVEIFDVYNPNPKSDPGPYQYHSLGTVSNTKTETIKTIHLASQLLAVYSGNMTLNGISVVYERFPVAVIGISVMDLPPYNWAISADDYTGMQQAFSFIVYTTANPNSVTAQNFQTALNTVAENKDTLLGTEVNTFFQNSASFRKATWVAWNQVVSWQTQSLSAWQGTYYLYNEPSGDETLQLMAVVNITSNTSVTSSPMPDVNVTVQPDAQSTGIMTSGTLSVPDENGIVQPDAQSTGIVQSGTGTITQADPAGSGMTLSLSVVPAWASFAKTSADSVNYAIGGSMLGTFNNTKVGGNGQKMNIPTSTPTSPSPSTPTSPPPSTPKASSGEQPSTTSLIFSVLAAITSFAMVYMMYMQWREGKKQADNKLVTGNLNSEENKAKIKAAQDKSDGLMDAEYKARMTERVNKATQLMKKFSALQKETKDAKLAEVFETQRNSLKAMLDEALNVGAADPDIETAVANYETAATEFQNGNLKAALETINSSCDSVQLSITTNGLQDDVTITNAQESFQQVRNQQEQEQIQQEEIKQKAQVEQSEKEKIEVIQQNQDDQDDDDQWEYVNDDVDEGSVMEV